MTLHDDAHERLLAELVTGESSRDAAGVRRALDGCEVCAERLRALERVTRGLETSAAIERDVLRDATEMQRAPGEDRVARVLEGASSGKRRPRVTRWLAAAALLLVAIWAVRTTTLDRYPDTGELFLAEPHPAGLTPHGATTSFATFGWDLPLPPNGAYRVTIWDSRDAERANPILTSDNLRTRSWSPSPEERKDLPVVIYWEVTVLEFPERAVRTEGTTAELRSR